MRARLFFLSIATAIIASQYLALSVQGQGAGIPQTQLVPLNPATPSGPPSQLGPSTGTLLPGGFPPASTAPRTNSVAPNGFGLGGFDPYAPQNASPFGSFGLSPGNGSALGAPAVTTPPSPAPLPSATPSFNSPGLFGNLFGGSSSVATTPIPGYAGSGGYYGGTYDNPSLYASPPAALYPPSGVGVGGDPYAGIGPTFPSSTPSTLFPGGLGGGGGLFGGSGAYAGNGSTSAFGLFRAPRLRHSYIGFGDESDSVNIHDTDVSVIFEWQNFLYSNRPLFVVPSFGLHLWDGPDFPDEQGTEPDLPANAYSGYLDFGWNSDPNQMLSTELGVRVGVFTDFDTFNSDSFRILGKGLVAFRLTPASTVKAGVYYLDRNRIKLLPAGGILYQPNPLTRWDIFFPEPKFARYCRTIGTYDVWWYLAGEYGGGSWTIQRASGDEQSIDINDIRVSLGFEWGLSDAIRRGQRIGFAEVGYVFDREVLYNGFPQDNFDPDDGVMFRIGLGY
ncbi:MAG: hypothetical protein AAF664_07195 [Planctomycetota bacterium]